MTIKVCKEKFNTNVKSVAIISCYAIQLGLIGLFIYGAIEFSLNNQFVGVMAMIFGGVLGAFINLICAVEGLSWLQAIQRKYKLFEWNEDC